MLVAVGRNSHPHLTGYNEREAVSRLFVLFSLRLSIRLPITDHFGLVISKRRKPSERVKAIEEYLVVYRKGWIELHKEWVSRLPCSIGSRSGN